MSGSAGALCSGYELVVRPHGERLPSAVGGGLHRRAFVGGGSDAQDLAARLASSRRPAGSSLRLHETDDNRPRNPLTSDTITGHNIAMTTNQDRPVPWTVFFGTGVYSHAVADRQATVTFCGRPTATAREWQRPGNEPGCQVCFRRMKAKS